MANTSGAYFRELVAWEESKSENRLYSNYCCNSIRQRGKAINTFVRQGNMTLEHVSGQKLNSKSEVVFSDRNHFAGARETQHVVLWIDDHQKLYAAVKVDGWDDHYKQLENVELRKHALGCFITGESPLPDGFDFHCWSILQQVVPQARRKPATAIPQTRFEAGTVPTATGTVNLTNVTGRVENHSGIPLPINVFLDHGNSRPFQEMILKNGQFYFHNIPAGDYHLTADFAAKTDAAYQVGHAKIIIENGRVSVDPSSRGRMEGKDVVLFVDKLDDKLNC